MYGYYWEKLHANHFWELKGLISCITPHAHCKELTLPQKYILNELAFHKICISTVISGLYLWWQNPEPPHIQWHLLQSLKHQILVCSSRSQFGLIWMAMDCLVSEPLLALLQTLTAEDSKWQGRFILNLPFTS